MLTRKYIPILPSVDPFAEIIDAAAPPDIFLPKTHFLSLLQRQI
jgi:hypothetical protein